MERFKERYIRWAMGMDSRTLEFVVREKLQEGKLKERPKRRAWRFERRLGQGRGGGSKELFRGDERKSSKGKGDLGLGREEKSGF